MFYLCPSSWQGLCVVYFCFLKNLKRWLLSLDSVGNSLRICYNAAITSCQKGGQVIQALRFLKEMQADRIEATSTSFNAAMSSFPANQWQMVLSFWGCKVDVDLNTFFRLRC